MSQPSPIVNCIHDISVHFINNSNFSHKEQLSPFSAFISLSKSKDEIHPVCYDSFFYINCLLDIESASIELVKKNFNTKLIIESSYLDVIFTKNTSNIISANLLLVIKQLKLEQPKRKQEDIIISHKKKVVTVNNILTNGEMCSLFKVKVFEFMQEQFNANKFNYFPHWIINKQYLKGNCIEFTNCEVENCLFGYESIDNRMRMLITDVNDVSNIECLEKYVMVALNESPMPVEIEPSKVDSVKVFGKESEQKKEDKVKCLFVNEYEVLNKLEYLGELRQKYLDE